MTLAALVPTSKAWRVFLWAHVGVQGSRGAEGTWNMSRSFGFERARRVLPQQLGGDRCLKQVDVGLWPKTSKDHTPASKRALVARMFLLHRL